MRSAGKDDVMGGLTMSQILFPTDYSDMSRAAGRMAADLARHFKAPLHARSDRHRESVPRNRGGGGRSSCRLPGAHGPREEGASS